MAEGLLENLAEFITQTTYDQLGEELIHLAKMAIADTIGVAVAGWNEQCVQLVKETSPASSTDGLQATLWGDGTRTDVEYAALINGTSSHALDYDDVLAEVTIHPSAPILAAVIPLAEAAKCSGRDVICAYHIGVEVMLRIGECMGFRHYELGWHSTCTLGTVGAAAACAHLLKLNEKKTAHAVAIACSMASGLQKNFGSMTKPLHVGLAGRNGIQAARLAQAGLTANNDIFGTRGFLHAFSGGVTTLDKVEAVTFGQPYGVLKTGITIKKFPCCFATHKMIQAALNLAKNEKFRFEDIDTISIVAPAKLMVPLIYSRPLSGLQGKFSAEYTVLAALADGKVGLSSFDDDQVARPEIQQKLSRVKVMKVEDVKKDAELLPVSVEVITRNQHSFKQSIIHAPGSLLNPMSFSELKEKWDDCWHYRLTTFTEKLAEETSTIFNSIFKLEEISQLDHWLRQLSSFFNITYLEKGVDE